MVIVLGKKKKNKEEWESGGGEAGFSIKWTIRAGPVKVTET